MAENSRPNRRADFRLTLSIPVKLTYVDPQTKRSKNISGVTRNLSANGIYIVTEKQLPPSTHFIIHFHRQELMIAPQAVNLKEDILENGQYGYGCKYENFSDSFESQMRAFLFRKEAMIRMKGQKE